MRLVPVLCTALALGVPAAGAQERACSNELRVELRGLRQTAAPVLVGIYGSAEQWLRTPALAATVEPARGLRSTIGALPPGEYAASAFQDLNGNADFDTNFIGIPTEPFAFSSGAAGFMGPPKFEQARFRVDACGAELLFDFTGSY
ncbi:MAG: DUF2141 domain-containing protein [Betaproteobacteria bacterium]